MTDPKDSDQTLKLLLEDKEVRIQELEAQVKGSPLTDIDLEIKEQAIAEAYADIQVQKDDIARQMSFLEAKDEAVSVRIGEAASKETTLKLQAIAIKHKEELVEQREEFAKTLVNHMRGVVSDVFSGPILRQTMQRNIPVDGGDRMDYDANNNGVAISNGAYLQQAEDVTTTQEGA